jgi:hypothetical protein
MNSFSGEIAKGGAQLPIVDCRFSSFEFRFSTAEMGFDPGGRERKGPTKEHHITCQTFPASIHKLARRVKKSSMETVSRRDGVAASLSRHSSG